MISLPPIPTLVQRTKALAALDLILSPDWQYRYYSFNSNWASNEQMASMRDGCGDEWWIVFHKSEWAALKGLGHESEAWSAHRDRLSNALRDVIPSELNGFAEEPAFRWDATSFAYFYVSKSEGWKRANDLAGFARDKDTGEEELLQPLISPAANYSRFAENYFETSVPIEIVDSIFSLQPITQDVVNRINADVDLADISTELFEEIGYPR